MVCNGCYLVEHGGRSRKESEFVVIMSRNNGV